MNDTIKISKSTPRRKVPPHLVYKLKISLLDAPYPIWRELLLDGTLTLRQAEICMLHCMQWTFSHLFDIEVNGKRYSKDEEFIDECDGELDTKHTLDEVFRNKPIGILTYDYGDSWTHEIIVEEILHDSTLPTPYCIAGQGACPPEDCGGVWGFQDMLKNLEDPDSDEYEELIEWLGGEFNPNDFDIKQVNKWKIYYRD